MIDKLINFLKESRIELKKVTWPTKNDTVRYTMTVIVISLAIAVFLGGLDYLFEYLISAYIL